MFETPEQFRSRIRDTLKGTFGRESKGKGIQSLSEEDPQAGQDQVAKQAPPNEADFKNSLRTAFESMSTAFKAKGSLDAGVKLKNSGNIADKAIKDMYSAATNPNMDMNAMSDAFVKGVNSVLDQVVKDTDALVKQNQVQQKNTKPENINQQNGQAPQQLNAEVGLGNNIQVVDEIVEPVVEREDPISVDSMQGILKFATPEQVGNAIKKMKPDEFQQFISGLQKAAIDVLAKSLNGGSVSPTHNNPNPTGGSGKNGKSGEPGNTDQDGNLQLSSL